MNYSDSEWTKASCWILYSTWVWEARFYWISSSSVVKNYFSSAFLCCSIEYIWVCCVNCVCWVCCVFWVCCVCCVCCVYVISIVYVCVYCVYVISIVYVCIYVVYFCILSIVYALHVSEYISSSCSPIQAYWSAHLEQKFSFLLLARLYFALEKKEMEL